jgi:DNA-directed RNA polymerase subunit RPC12/RpoP
MDKREEKVTYGCFRCGTKVSVEDDLIRTSHCEDCGSVYLITYQEALDILNDLFLKKKFKPQVLVENDDSDIVDAQDDE